MSLHVADYYILTGVADGLNKPSDDFASSSTCTLPAVDHGLSHNEVIMKWTKQPRPG